MKSDHLYTQTAQLLIELEQALKNWRRWSSDVPTESQLASQEPFCCDTLTFEQWLQFIFIPRMDRLIVSKQPLPAHMQLLPMAEQVWASESPPATLVSIIKKFDALYA